MKARRYLFGTVALGVVAGGILAGCSSLPPLEGRTTSTAYLDTAGTRLGAATAALNAAHPGLSGIYPLVGGRDAFAARALLARAAERSLDVQYYIWRNDTTGALMFDALRNAADRGVRVRLLLDDNNTSGLDATLAQLDAHKNIEVRLFNPFIYRDYRLFGFLTDFARLNRRMHNKSFTADNQATIVGGRNIGDEYFGAAGDILFVDLDVMAIGPVVTDVSRDFDRYWNSQSAYPLALLVGKNPTGEVKAPGSAALQPAARAYVKALEDTTFVEQLMHKSLELEWGATELVSDDPAKVLDRATEDGHLAPQLRELLGEPKRSTDLVSPYLVPGEEGAAALIGMAREGIRVRILTNSLEATDVAAVHSGYAKWRESLVRSGVALYELRRSWSSEVDKRHMRGGPFGSSATSLHAKTFSVDDARFFVGSFNFDLRSIALNTEMGFVIDSPALAQRLTKSFDENMPTRAYEVKLDADGKLYWIERRDNGEEIRHDTEPGSSIWERAAVGFLSWLPIDWLL
jgi:putative cardiolipin synthase